MNTTTLYDDFPPITIIQAQLVAFMRLARSRGFKVGMSEEVDGQRLLIDMGILNKSRVKTCLRALMCSTYEEWSAFDEFFDRFWHANNLKSEMQPTAGSPLDQSSKSKNGHNAGRTVAVQADAIGLGNHPYDNKSGTREGASSGEIEETSDFGFLMDEAEMQAAQALAEELARKMSMRKTRRLKASHKRRRLDMRRTVRASLRYGGEAFHLNHRQQYQRPWKLVVLLDVSKSMSMYSGVFLRFIRGLVTTFDTAHAFAFHTRLVPLTTALRTSNLTELRDRMKVLSAGWAGGTRIGECLEVFTNQYKHTLTRNSIVMILSDGLDTGEEDHLRIAMERVKNNCHRFIWLNPLLGRQGYQPEARGMKTALPFIDLFAPAHNLKSLKALEPELSRI